MDMPTVANPDMAVHLIVDDDDSGIGQRGSRFFGRMLAYHAAVIILSTLLTATPINYSSAQADSAAPAPPQALEKSHCSDVQVSEDCTDGRADPICADTDGCMPCAIDSAMQCVRYTDGRFCDDWNDGIGGYGYGELDDTIVHMDLVYMPLIGLLMILITILGVLGNFRRSRALFALHAVLLPVLVLTCIICMLTGALMGSHESDDCRDRPPSSNRDNICARVAPYYASGVLCLLLSLAHGYAVRQHNEAGTYAKGLSALVNLVRATSLGQDEQFEMSTLGRPDAPMPPTIEEAHEEIRRLRSQLHTLAANDRRPITQQA